MFSVKPNLSRRHLIYVYALLSIALIAYGSVYFVKRFASSRQPLPSPTVVVDSTTNTPSERPLDVHHDTYKVAADMPRVISLPTIQAEGFIQQVAIDDQHNEIAVPSNIHFAGWYNKSVKPGDAGLSIIDGHVSGYYQPGIFKKLKELKVNDQFSITFGDGAKRQFKVNSNSAYAVDQTSTALFSKQPAITSQLNLITCGGRYDKTTHQYDQRIVIVAERL